MKNKELEKELKINKIADKIFADWRVISLEPRIHAANRDHFQFAFILRKIAELKYEMDLLKTNLNLTTHE